MVWRRMRTWEAPVWWAHAQEGAEMAARPAHDPLHAYQPPTPSFTPCEVCGMVCLRDKGVLVTACLVCRMSVTHRRVSSTGDVAVSET